MNNTNTPNHGYEDLLVDWITEDPKLLELFTYLDLNPSTLTRDTERWIKMIGTAIRLTQITRAQIVLKQME